MSILGRELLTAAVVLALAACGGGGGTSSSSPTPPADPNPTGSSSMQRGTLVSDSLTASLSASQLTANLNAVDNGSLVLEWGGALTCAIEVYRITYWTVAPTPTGGVFHATPPLPGAVQTAFQQFEAQVIATSGATEALDNYHGVAGWFCVIAARQFFAQF